MAERWFMAKCRDCAPPLAMPFSVESRRLAWCEAHKRGHTNIGQLDTVIDQYEELQRYRTVFMAGIDSVSKATVIVCGHVECERDRRTMKVTCALGGVVTMQAVLDTIDEHYRKEHNDE